MAQVTTNTQINTINILDEANSANNTDLILLQRGSKSYKLKKENLTLPVNQISPITNYNVVGNKSGGGDGEQIPIDTISEGLGSTDNTMATSGAIKEYVDGASLIGYVYKETTLSDSVNHGRGTIPDMFFCHINGIKVEAYVRPNGTDGGLYHASVKADANTISIYKPSGTYDIPATTRTFTAIWFA